jgi:lipopolysaccharide export system protein LptA
MSRLRPPGSGLLLVALAATLALAPLNVPAAYGQAQPATSGQAQSLGNSFGGFSKNSGQPIDIESDVLVVHDSQKYATFKGNVKAVQGTTTIHSKELDVHYLGSGSDSLTGAAPAQGAGGKAATPAPATPAAGAPAPAAPQGVSKVANADPKAAAGGTGGVALGDQGNQISKIEARGDVIITSDQDQTTTSDWALYDVPAHQVTVGGNVVLTQGKNVLKGDRLVIDLTTGESRFENTGNAAAAGQRIRALFMPKQDAAAKGAKAGNGQSGKDSAGTDKSAKENAGSEKSAGAPADETVEGKPAEDDATAEGAAPEPLFPGLPH